MKTAILLLVAASALAQDASTPQTTPKMEPVTPTLMHGFRPSIWSRTVHHLRNGKRYPPGHKNMAAVEKSTQMHPIPPLLVTPSPEDDESQILQSSTAATVKDFANRLINETVALFSTGPQARAYSSSYSASAGGEDYSQQQTQQLWEDKDQSYHASSYSGLDYEPPTSYHQPFHHPPPPHYYPMPQKKDELFTKVALIALLKLILAKLKAIGLLKIFLLFFLKVPIFFFKMLIAFKGLKFLKLLSIPFLIAAFAIPFLPLIPLLLFTFLPLLLLIPLAIPLLLPLLLFLPIVPVTQPPTAAGRKRRDIPVTESVSAGNMTWSIPEEERKDRKKKMFQTTRSRPSSSPRYVPFLNEEHAESLIELTQRVVQSQQCMERAACELAAYNDSKIYQTAVIWALSKLQSYAPAMMQRRIEQYAYAYEKGSQSRSSNTCSEKFKCVRPKLYLVQGPHSYNLV